jgi:predicted HD superfamily hydrolase involved in NAD metabolism
MPIIQTPRAKEFIHLLRTRVSEKTMSHCVFTAEYLASFAGKADITNDQAVTAGLLHDLWKGVDNEDMIAAARKYGIEPNAVQLRKPSLLHGPVAAEECRRELGIKDDAIYEAIYWHTTGHLGLGNVGLALYVADFAEPLRSFPEAAEARRVIRKEGFAQALRYVADEKLKHVRTKPDIDQTTEAFHAWLETILK